MKVKAIGERLMGCMVAVALAGYGWRQMAPLLAKEGLSFYRLHVHVLALFAYWRHTSGTGNGDRIYCCGALITLYL